MSRFSRTSSSFSSLVPGQLRTTSAPRSLGQVPSSPSLVANSIPLVNLPRDPVSNWITTGHSSPSQYPPAPSNDSSEVPSDQWTSPATDSWTSSRFFLPFSSPFHPFANVPLSPRPVAGSAPRSSISDDTFSLEPIGPLAMMKYSPWEANSLTFSLSPKTGEPVAASFPESVTPSRCSSSSFVDPVAQKVPRSNWVEKYEALLSGFDERRKALKRLREARPISFPRTPSPVAMDPVSLPVAFKVPTPVGSVLNQVPAWLRKSSPRYSYASTNTPTAPTIQYQCPAWLRAHPSRPCLSFKDIFLSAAANSPRPSPLPPWIPTPTPPDDDDDDDFANCAFFSDPDDPFVSVIPISFIPERSLSVSPMSFLSVSLESSPSVFSVFPVPSPSGSPVPFLSVFPVPSPSVFSMPSSSVLPAPSLSVLPTPSLPVLPVSSLSVSTAPSIPVLPTSSLPVLPVSSLSVLPTPALSVLPISSLSVIPAPSLSVSTVSSPSVFPAPFPLVTSLSSVLPVPVHDFHVPCAFPDGPATSSWFSVATSIALLTAGAVVTASFFLCG